MHDISDLEQRGVPGVFVASDEFVVAADSARFWTPEAGLGIIPDAGAIRLPRRLPPAVAHEMLYAGRRMDAEEARRWGLVNAVVPGAELMDAARELAGRIAASAPLAAYTP